MRTVFGVIALACVAGAFASLAQHSWRGLVLFVFGMWVSGGWYVAMSVAAAAKRGDEGFGRDEGDE